MHYTNKVTLFSGKDINSTSTQSAAFLIGDRRRLSVQITATNITSGNGIFTFDISNDDGSTWTRYQRLITNVTNTNAQNNTRVNSVQLTASTSNFIFFDEGDYFEQIRANVTTTTDGSYSAVLYTGI